MPLGGCRLLPRATLAHSGARPARCRRCAAALLSSSQQCCSSVHSLTSIHRPRALDHSCAQASLATAADHALARRVQEGGGAEGVAAAAAAAATTAALGGSGACGGCGGTATAPSVPLAFRRFDESDGFYVCTAGCYYDSRGPVEVPLDEFGAPLQQQQQQQQQQVAED